MTPPQVHISLELSCRLGMLPINTVGAPGRHGAGVAGTQGMGVITPNLAAVAAATTGFAMLLQVPKGRIFTNGLWSMMFAAGMLLVTIPFTGKTISEEGAAPKLHCSIAPIQTCIPMFSGLSRFFPGFS